MLSQTYDGRLSSCKAEDLRSKIQLTLTLD